MFIMSLRIPCRYKYFYLVNLRLEISSDYDAVFVIAPNETPGDITQWAVDYPPVGTVSPIRQTHDYKCRIPADPFMLVCASHMALIDAAKENWSIRSEEHTSELQSLMRTSYAVFCLKKKKHNKHTIIQHS